MSSLSCRSGEISLGTLATDVHATSYCPINLHSRAVNALVIWLVRQFTTTHNKTPRKLWIPRIETLPLQQTSCTSLLLSIDGTDRQTDGRTPDRYIDSARHTMQAASIATQLWLLECILTNFITMFFLDYILRSERIETSVNCAIPRSDVHLLSEK